MAAAVRLREDYNGDDLRRLACKARHGAQVRRLMALAAIADGQNRAAAAAVGLMDRQTLRDWVVRFNADGPEGLIDKPSPGRPPKLTPAQNQEVRQLVEEGPGRYDPHLVRWRRAGLAVVVRDRFAITCHSRRRSAGSCGSLASRTSARDRAIPRRTTRRRKSLKKILQEISRTVAAGAHGIVVMDKAGWHTTAALQVPANLSLLHLPPRSPELNPQARVCGV